MKIVFLILIVISFVISQSVLPCGQYHHYMQCGEPWRNVPLGTSKTETICTAGIII